MDLQIILIILRQRSTKNMLGDENVKEIKTEQDSTVFCHQKRGLRKYCKS